MTWDAFVTLIRDVPDVIWSGIIAALIAFVGVMLSNLGNTSRLIRQLQHDAREKSKDRNGALRREVYLRAAEELVRANARLGALAQLDPTEKNLADGFQELFVVGAKAQLVSSTATYKAIGELMAVYGEIWFHLLKEVQPIHDLQIELSTIQATHDEAGGEVRRILSAIKSFNEAAQTNDAVFNALTRSFGYHEEQRRIAAARKIELLEVRGELVFKFSEKVMIAMKRVAEAQIPATVAIRRELELGGDVSDFESYTLENQKRMEVALDGALRWMASERSEGEEKNSD